MKRLTLLLLAIANLISVYSQTSEQIVPENEAVLHGVLPNGLTYYVQKCSKSKNLAEFRLIQKSGSLVEAEDERGMSHFVEHMMFKGTKHFAGSSIINFLNRIGVKFGADTNAFTTYDFVNYVLSGVPLADKANIDSCLLILRDISADAIIDKKAMDAERNVIEEERRMRFGDGTIDQSLQDLYAGTKLVTNNPIGKSEVIKNCTQKHLMAFYKKWYQPQNQIIIAAGDFDPDSMVTKIKVYFGDQEKGTTVIPEIELPESADVPAVSIIKTKTIKAMQILVKCRQDYPSREEMRKVKYFTQEMIKAIVQVELFRCYDSIKNEEPLIMSMAVMTYPFEVTSKAICNAFLVECAPEVWKEALTKGLTEIEKIKRFGITEKIGTYRSENSPEDSALNLGQKIDWDKDVGKMDTDTYANLAINFLLLNSLNGQVYVSPKTKRILDEYIVSAITKEMISQTVKELYSKRNCVIQVLVPDDSTVVAPTKEEVLAVLDDVEKADLNPEVASAKKQDAQDSNVHGEPYDNVNPTPGKIVSVKPAEESGYTEYTLSNGVKVQLKKDAHSINDIEATIDGGKTWLENAELPYSSFVDGMDDVKYTYKDRDHSQETMLKEFYYKMTSNEVDSADFVLEKKRLYGDMLKFKAQSELLTRGMMTFQYVSAVRMNNHLTKQIIDTLTADGMRHILAKIHRNYNGMVVRMSSREKEDSVIHALIEKYIGSLPSMPTPVGCIDRPEDHFKDYDDKKVEYYEDVQPMSYGSLCVGQEKGVVCDELHHAHLEALEVVLNQLLLDRIRVKHSDVYSITVAKRGQWERPFPQQWFQIIFPCAPEKTDDILADVKALLREAADRDVITQKLLDSYVNGKEKMQGNDGMPRLPLSAAMNDDDVTKMSVVKSVTVDSLRKFLKDMLDNGHTYEYILRTK